MFGLMRKKTHKRIIASLKDAHNQEMKIVGTIPIEMEEKCLGMMQLMKKRHDIDIRALQQFKARPRKCPYCKESIQPK